MSAFGRSCEIESPAGAEALVATVLDGHSSTGHWSGDRRRLTDFSGYDPKLSTRL